ncbi:twin-arginine translocase TatA/TatE family subunit [bacterium]|nr:twin-arginine translocase TatA/TatE family subunit [bacterium]
MLPSGGELLIIVFVVFLLFGGRELPKIARTMGKWTAMMKRSLNDVRREFNRISIEEELKESTQSIRDLKDDPLGLKNLATPDELKKESKKPEAVVPAESEPGSVAKGSKDTSTEADVDTAPELKPSSGRVAQDEAEKADPRPPDESGSSEKE